MNEKCILNEDKICNNCGECDKCDLDSAKICDNCGRCLDDGDDYKEIMIDGIMLEDK